MPGSEKAPNVGIRFSPNIELGHLLQAIVMLGAIGGWALVGYQTVEKQLSQHEAEMLLFKQRMTADEKDLADLRDALRNSTTETRAILNKISDQLSDLRVLVANPTAASAPGPRR